jgi:hypothetical protein
MRWAECKPQPFDEADDPLFAIHRSLAKQEVLHRVTRVPEHTAAPGSWSRRRNACGDAPLGSLVRRANVARRSPGNPSTDECSSFLAYAGMQEHNVGTGYKEFILWKGRYRRPGNEVPRRIMASSRMHLLIRSPWPLKVKTKVTHARLLAR